MELDILNKAKAKADTANRELRAAQAEIGDLMRAKREASGISLRSLAKRMLVTPPFLCDLEYGRRNWNEKWIRLYEKRLGEE